MRTTIASNNSKIMEWENLHFLKNSFKNVKIAI